MNSKMLPGSLLTGFGLLAIVANAWAQHFFFTQFHIARATTLEATGEFNPGTYLAGPEAVELFIVTRILLWGVTLFGLLLVAWGIWEQHQDRDC